MGRVNGKFFPGSKSIPKKVNELKKTPFNFFLDLILSAVISALIPIPFIDLILMRYKKMFVLGIIGFGLMFIGLIAIIFLFLASPFFLPFFQTSNISTSSINSLVRYIESGFNDTDTPLKNPFGGIGMSNTITTVNFHDIESFFWDDRQITETEQGIDIVPNNLYFLTNKAAKLTGEPIVFATLNGITKTYTDANGALTVEITNTTSSIKTISIHLQQILVENNANIRAGEPIGVMGSTGMSTGPHLEYQVRINKNGSWIAVNPTEFIK